MNKIFPVQEHLFPLQQIACGLLEHSKQLQDYAEEASKFDVKALFCSPMSNGFDGSLFMQEVKKYEDLFAATLKKMWESIDTFLKDKKTDKTPYQVSALHALSGALKRVDKKLLLVAE